MSFSCTSILALVLHLATIEKTNADVTLPKTWTKDFIITVSYTGSMDGSSTSITFTFDSCKYVQKSGMKPKKEDSFVLTASERAEILNKLHAFKADKIRSEIKISPVDDGWSTLICFGNRCIEGGTSATMSDADKEQFNRVYDYLEGFAAKKVKR